MLENLRDNKGRFKKGNKGFWLSKKRDLETNKKISKSLIGKFLCENSGNWKGGKYIGKDGYIRIHSPLHPKVKNSKRKYVFEHTIVAEKNIGRYLKENECVHHINGIRDDNRSKNLIVLTKSEHSKIHSRGKNYNKYEIDKKYLNKLYTEKFLSINKIAKKFNVSFKVIRSRLLKYKINIRSRDNGRMDKKHYNHSLGINSRNVRRSER